MSVFSIGTSVNDDAKDSQNAFLKNGALVGTPFFYRGIILIVSVIIFINFF